jgi:hypothetical protein
VKSIKRYLSIAKEKNARTLILVGIVIFNVLLWLISSVLAYILSPGQYGDVLTSLWESGITWMLEPGFYDPSVDYSIRVLSIVVILISMITFSGGIIGYVASLFSSIIEKAETGQSALYIYNHVLILNWNHKALELIVDYCFNDEISNVVILSNRDKKEIEDKIAEKLFSIKKNKTKKINVLVRQGDVLSKKDLLDNHIEEAKSIIILKNDQYDTLNEKYQDMLSIKTLMLLNQFDIKKEQTIIVEIQSELSKDMIQQYISKNSKLNSQIVTVLPDELMGRLIAQTILMPELSEVYAELFSFKGSEFYSLPKSDPLEYMKIHNHSIPIYDLNGYLYVISESPEYIELKRNTPLDTYRKIKVKNQMRYTDRNLVVFGKNNKLAYILDSLKLYELENNTKVNVFMVDLVESQSIFESLSKIEKIDTILILSDDKQDSNDYDSDVLITLLLTQDIVKKHSANIVVELLDPRHNDIAKSYNVTNTIISNEYISRIMTQLSNNRSLYPLYEDLLTYDSIDSTEETYEVYAYKAGEIFEENFPLKFDSKSDFIYSCYQSTQQEFIVIGIVKNHQTIIFKGNLDLKEDIIIDSKDSVIVICK